MTKTTCTALVFAATFAIGTQAQAATVTVGPGGFDAGYATSITYEYDNAVARRGTANTRDNALNALGAADGDFFEIGFGSTIDLTFGTTFDTSVSIFEITFGSAARFPESVELLVGSGGSFTSVGSVSNVAAAGGVTVALGSGVFDTVRLIDTSPLSSSAQSDALGRLGGFDVDSVRVTPSVVPVPAALPLLAMGIGGLGLMARRRKSRT